MTSACQPTTMQLHDHILLIQLRYPFNKYKKVAIITVTTITYRVSCRQREMYCGHLRLCVCLSAHGHMPTLLHGPGCNLWEC